MNIHAVMQTSKECMFVFVCALSMCIPGVCMFIPWSLAAGFRSYVGGSRFVWVLSTCWVCSGSERCAVTTQEVALVHKLICRVDRPITKECTSPPIACDPAAVDSWIQIKWNDSVLWESRPFCSQQTIALFFMQQCLWSTFHHMHFE